MMKFPDLRRPPGWAIMQRFFNCRVAALLAVAAFFLAGSAQVRDAVDRNAYSIHFDEYHTIYLGTKVLDPWLYGAYTKRVGETTRWFVRFLYPLGVYYMNTRMSLDYEAMKEEPGHNPWAYPGGYYLRNNFIHAKLECKEDQLVQTLSCPYPFPNLQDYIFAMRLALGIILVLSFLPVMWQLFRRSDIVAGVIYGALILYPFLGGASLVFPHTEYFYTPSVLIILFNLSMFLVLRLIRPDSRWDEMIFGTALLGFLSGAALSAKLTGIFVAVPAFLHSVDRVWRVAVWFLFAASSYIAINFWIAESLFGFINETLSNVWNYGGARVKEDTPLTFLPLVLDDLGILFVTAFVFALVWLGGKLERRFLPVYGLGAVIMLVIWSLSNVSVYLSRNLVLPYVAMSFVQALAVGEAARRVAESRFRGVAGGALRCRGVITSSAMVVVALVVVFRIPSAEAVFFERNAATARSCESLAVFGMARGRAAAAVGWNDIAVFERLDGSVIDMNLVRDLRVPVWDSRTPSAIYAEYKKYVDYDCLIVKRQGENKHISNYFATLNHDMMDRVGEFFFYKRKRS